MENKMRKTELVVILSLTLALLLTPVVSVSAEDISLTITGNGVEKETVITFKELKGMTEQMTRNVYSAWNTWPAEKTYYAEGVPLSELLKRAGLKPEATTINIAAAPEADGSVGYNQTFLLDDLLGERYTFKNAKTAVPAIIAVKLGESSFTDMDEADMRLIYGQLADSEQTTVGFVQKARIITVTCAPVKKLAQPTAEAERQPDGGYLVTLKSDNVNAKVYYTTDGSEPTASSKMYNISAPHWQPELNIPFKVSGSAEVKAIAVASGFESSEVLRFNPVSLDTGSGTGIFLDVPESYWAAKEINSLSEKGIIAGMGGGLFAPAQTLTRAQFAKIIVLAVNGKEPPSMSSAQFSDVSAGVWYAPYVAEGVRLGLFTGYSDGTFKPDDPVTREQMLAIAIRALPDGESKDAGGGSAYTAAGISSWAKGYVEYAESAGLIAKEMKGEKDGLLYFEGGKAGIRAEAAYVAYHMMPLL